MEPHLPKTEVYINFLQKSLNYNRLNDSLRIIHAFEFEKVPVAETYEWVMSVKRYVNFVAIGYLIFLFVGPMAMRNRKAWNLRRPLMIWNWTLAIFSMAGTLRMAPTLFYLALTQPDGYYRSICQRDMWWEPENFWALLFILSKLFELMDTVFIVLRKSNLTFLHCYHHVSVLVSCFYLAQIYDPVTRWDIVVNYSVHSVMYSYYALKMSKVKVPKWISITITTIQMLQFVALIGASCQSMYFKYSGARDCVLHPHTMAYQIIGLTSYFILFGNYFVKTYILKRGNSKAIKKE